MLSGDDSGVLRQLNCLSPALRSEFGEEIRRMRLHGVLTDRQFLGDLTIAESLRDELEDLELTRRQSEPFDAGGIDRERPRDLHFDDDLLLLRELEAEPDAERCENARDQQAIE